FGCVPPLLVGCCAEPLQITKARALGPGPLSPAEDGHWRSYSLTLAITSLQRSINPAPKAAAPRIPSAGSGDAVCRSFWPALALPVSLAELLAAEPAWP